MRHKKINKKYEELINDFIDLSDKLDVRIIHDKGDFNGDDCLLFSDKEVSFTLLFGLILVFVG